MILVVEDNDAAREGLSVVLQEEGYEVAAVGDGREALTYLHNNPPPRVILLDMFLPVLDGWRFLKVFEGLSLDPKPAIIITTGNPAISTEWALSHGCNGFLRKPVGKDSLLQELRRAGAA